MNAIFGPVPSRRLGRSLGVDVVPFKTCTYDCVYCQLGRTTCRTVEQREWVSVDDVLGELAGRLDSQPDVITISGSGEPTLCLRLGEMINRIKAITSVPVVVLTNGSLLWRPEVRSQLLAADLVLPSLDAGDEAMFRTVNRPHPDISFDQMLDGLITFRREFQGQYWLEVFLLAGHTAIEAEAAKLARCVERIAPDKVQLNTAVRPPAETFAVGATRERMAELAKMFGPNAEVIADFHATFEQPEFHAGRQAVLELLKRRPCSLDDISAGLGMHRNQVVKYVQELADDGAIRPQWSAQRQTRLYVRIEAEAQPHGSS